MLGWKFRKLVVAMLPLVLTFYSQFADPIKRLFLGHYDIRWYHSQDTEERTQTIAIRNRASRVASPIRFQIDAPRKAIADFDGGSFVEGPRTSFLLTIALSASLTPLVSSEEDKIIAMLDEHYPATLNGLEEALSDALVSRLRAVGHSSRVIEGVLGRPATHANLLIRCVAKRARTSRCRVERALERWEQSMRLLRREATTAWGKATGVGVSFMRSYLSPEGKIDFVFTLGANESRFLTIRYGADAVNSLGEISTEMREVIPVDDAADLDASGWWIAARYHPLQTVAFLLLLSASLWVAWVLLKPIRSLRTFQIFNLALRTDGTDNEEIWEVAYEKTKYSIISEFRQFCSVFEKGNIATSPEEVFDFLRDRLRVEYALQKIQFANREGLESTMRRHIRDLAIIT